MLKLNEKLIINIAIYDGGVVAYCNLPQYAAEHLTNLTKVDYRVVTATNKTVYQVKQCGDTEAGAVKALLGLLQSNNITGVAAKGKVLNQTTEYRNRVAYTKTSGIPGDSYSQRITNSSSLNTICRSLCD